MTDTPNDMRDEHRLKAYLLLDKQRRKSKIVFALDRREIWQRLATWVPSASVQHVVVYREKLYDHFSDLGYVPKAVLFEDGWPYVCDQCAQVLLPGQALPAGDHLFCGNPCLQEFTAQHSQVTPYLEMVENLTTSLLKGCQVEGGWVDGLSGKVATVLFRFPGAIAPNKIEIVKGHGADIRFRFCIGMEDTPAWEYYCQDTLASEKILEATPASASPDAVELA